MRFIPVRRASLKKRPNDLQKLTLIRALYIMVFNAEESVIPLAVELFHIIGSILEGTTPEALPFSRVSKKTFLETYQDLLQRDPPPIEEDGAEEESEKDD
jgi:hypothetical protein